MKKVTHAGFPFELIEREITGFQIKKVNGIVLCKPVFKRRRMKPTARQVETQNNFANATAFAKAIFNDPDQRAIYEARLGRKSLYRSLITEYFRITKNNC